MSEPLVSLRITVAVSERLKVSLSNIDVTAFSSSTQNLSHRAVICIGHLPRSPDLKEGDTTG